MKISYFESTDTLYIGLNAATIAETRDFGENIIFDFAEDGNICAITIEHASKQAGMPQLSYEQIRA
jgi:uncharacterized protein YuzE